HLVDLRARRLPVAAKPLRVYGHGERHDPAYGGLPGAEGRHVLPGDPGLASRRDRGHGGRARAQGPHAVPRTGPQGHEERFDGTHLTAKFAKSIAPSVDAYLKDSGVIPR